MKNNKIPIPVMGMGIIKLIDKAEIKLEHVLENDPRNINHG